MLQEIIATRVGRTLIRENGKILHAVRCRPKNGSLVELIAVETNERIEPNGASIPVRSVRVCVLAERDEPICEVREISNPRPRGGHVDVDKSRDVPVLEDQVVRCDVIQAHNLDWLVRRQLPRCARVR